MAKPYTQDVILDADGKPLFDAMTTLERRVANIAKTINKIQTDSFKTANALNKTIDANIKSLNKVQSQMNALGKIGATDRNVSRTLAGRDAGLDAARYGTNSAKIGYQLELEKKLQALANARTEQEKRAGIEAVRTAQARLQAILQIEAAERRTAAEVQRASKQDTLSAHRQRLALSRQFADSERKALGSEEALRLAKERQISAERRLAGATALTREDLRRNLDLENARLRAIERIIAAENRQRKAQNGNPPTVTPGGGGPPGRNNRTAVQNILSPEYGAAAFARTSVYGAAAAAAYGVFNTIRSGIQGAIQLEDELARLQAISGATDTQLVSLKSTIFEIGKESRFSVVDLAKISEVLAQAGIATREMPNVLRSVTQLATASGSTPDEAVQLVTSALGAFQLQGSEAARVADLIAEALNRTKLTVQQVGQAIQYVGATAYEQNIGLEQLLATIGAVAQAGVKSGSTIGTGFRQFLVDLQDPTKKLTEQLKLLGLTQADVDVRTRGLPAVLETLQKAGFGATQAYEGLEVRAAAFYLTAKNNVDIIDRLQLAFTQQGAAAQANERAMSSLSAQWQRFKNILQTNLFEGLEGPMEVLKRLIATLSETIQDMADAAANLEDRRKKLRDGGGTAFEKLKYFDERISNLIGTTSEKIIEWTLNQGPGDALGSALIRGAGGVDKFTASSERLSTKIADANEKIEAQRGKLGELDKELLRVITQKESLRDNETRTAAETSNLSSRFQGLALNLVNTGNAYDDLVRAMKAYKYQQMQLLGTDLLAQQANLTLQTADQRNRGKLQAQKLLRDPNFASQVNDPRVMQALIDIRDGTPGTRGFNDAQAVLADAVRRFSETNRELAGKLNIVVDSMGKVAYNTQQIISNDLQIGNQRAASTDVGRLVTDKMQEVEAIVQQLGSQENGSASKKSLTDRALGIITNVENEVSRRLKMGQSEWSKRFLVEAQQGLSSLRTQVKALNAPTSDEVKESKAQEREAQRGPKLTQAELDSIAKNFLGLALGSGVRSAAEQNALYRAKRTPADAAHSAHSNGGVARDFPVPASMSDAQARSLANSLSQKFKNLGVDVFVQFETGKGRNQGTGRHIHASARPGTRWKGSAAGSDADELANFARAQNDAQLSLDQRGLKSAFGDISDATTAEALNVAIVRARAAMSKVKEDLEQQARDDLEKGGIGPGMPQYQERMARLQDEVAQLVDEYAKRIADAMIKASKEIIKSAQEQFESSLQPSQRAANVAAGVVQGLGFASNQGKVPDYTIAIAQQQQARADEAEQRARLDNLPSLISQYQTTIDQLTASLDSPELTESGIAQVNAQIIELTNNLEGLVTQRESLEAAFGANGMIPTTFREGLNQAIEAYRQLNGLNLTFTQQVNNELTGAISSLHSGLTDMFATIFSGSASAGQAILSFAKAMLAAITQIVAKIIATRIISLVAGIFASVGGSIGGYTGGALDTVTPGAASVAPGPLALMAGGRVRGRAYGGGTNGLVSAGHNMRDNVFTKLLRGEWVVNKRAVDSVGHDFMADLNARGSGAVDRVKSDMPKLDLKSEQKVNVWMVKPDEMPQMGPNDVLVTWQQDVLQGGQSKKLIQAIARESKY